MVRPDFRDYKSSGNELMHSAKGTTWGKHKYISKTIVNGKVRYIYAKAMGKLTQGLKKTGTDKKVGVSTTILNELNDLKRDYQKKLSKYNDEKYIASARTVRFGKDTKSLASGAVNVQKAKKEMEEAKKKYEKMKAKVDAMFDYADYKK